MLRVDSLPNPAGQLTAHVRYQLVEIGYHVLLSVGPAFLDEFHRAAGGVQIGGGRAGDESLKVGEILVAAREHLQRDQWPTAATGTDSPGSTSSLVAPATTSPSIPELANSRSTTTSDPACSSRTPDRRST